MSKSMTSVWGIILMAAVSVTVGCPKPAAEDDGGTKKEEPTKISGPPPSMGNDSGSGHSHIGPHDGHLVELGRNHEYHAEIVDDEESGMVTIYILDTEMKELAIDQPSVSITMQVGGTPKMFELKASGATDGKTSKFELKDPELIKTLHDKTAKGKLRVSINGEPLLGEIEAHEH